MTNSEPLSKSLGNFPPVNDLRRELARRYLAEWLPMARGYYRWDWPHTRLIADHLQAVADNELEHLMVLCPPQHGKSELCTISFAVWLLYRNPATRVALAAYNQQLADRFSRQARRIAEDGWVRISTDRGAVQEWQTAQGGGVRAVGIGAGLTGNPVDFGIIDDPVKDREEADSIGYRDKQWEWYTDVFSTRNPAHKLVTLTPWHEDGLQARILNSPEGKRWTVLRLPAISLDNDPLGRSLGEPLCPDRKSLEDLILQRDMNPYSFEALFQCNPTPREGAFFKVAEFRYLDAVPELTDKVRRWDVASSPDGDWTAGVLMGQTAEGLIVITDVVRFRATTDERNRRMRETADQDGPDVQIVVPEDPGAAGKDMALAYVRLFAGYRVKAVRETGSKEVRADPYSAQVNAGNVALLRASWNQPFVEEHRVFPNGKHDDQIDAGSGAFSEVFKPRQTFAFAIA